MNKQHIQREIRKKLNQFCEGEKEFTVTEDHIKLLQSAYVGWDYCEYGAPSIDCKRPYGNSDATGDIFEILGWPYDAESDDFTEAEQERAFTIHCETQIVLQLMLKNLPEGVYPGTYNLGVYPATPQCWKRKE